MQSGFLENVNFKIFVIKSICSAKNITCKEKPKSTLNEKNKKDLLKPNIDLYFEIKDWLIFG